METTTPKPTECGIDIVMRFLGGKYEGKKSAGDKHHQGDKDGGDALLNPVMGIDNKKQSSAGTQTNENDKQKGTAQNQIFSVYVAVEWEQTSTPLARVRIAVFDGSKKKKAILAVSVPAGSKEQAERMALLNAFILALDAKAEKAEFYTKTAIKKNDSDLNSLWKSQGGFVWPSPPKIQEKVHYLNSFLKSQYPYPEFK